MQKTRSGPLGAEDKETWARHSARRFQSKKALKQVNTGLRGMHVELCARNKPSGHAAEDVKGQGMAGIRGPGRVAEASMGCICTASLVDAHDTRDDSWRSHGWHSACWTLATSLVGSYLRWILGRQLCACCSVGRH